MAVGAGFTDYDSLPEIIKGYVTRTEYAWLSDEGKCNLIEELTTPPELDEMPE